MGTIYGFALQIKSSRVASRRRNNWLSRVVPIPFEFLRLTKRLYKVNSSKLSTLHWSSNIELKPYRKQLMRLLRELSRIFDFDGCTWLPSLSPGQHLAPSSWATAGFDSVFARANKDFYTMRWVQVESYLKAFSLFVFPRRLLPSAGSTFCDIATAAMRAMQPSFPFLCCFSFVDFLCAALLVFTHFSFSARFQFVCT